MGAGKGCAMGEYGYDYDTGEVVYHHDDGITSTGADGSEYVSAGEDFSVAVKSGEVHYTPTGDGGYSSGGTAETDRQTFWLIIGVILSVACFGYIMTLDDTGAKHLGKVLLYGVLAFLCFFKIKNP